MFFGGGMSGCARLKTSTAALHLFCFDYRESDLLLRGLNTETSSFFFKWRHSFQHIFITSYSVIDGLHDNLVTSASFCQFCLECSFAFRQSSSVVFFAYDFVNIDLCLPSPESSSIIIDLPFLQRVLRPCESKTVNFCVNVNPTLTVTFPCDFRRFPRDHRSLHIELWLHRQQHQHNVCNLFFINILPSTNKFNDFCFKFLFYSSNLCTSILVH